MYTVEWVDYFDVWGNEEEGFWVNNLSHEWTKELDNLDKDTLFDLLLTKGVLRADAEIDRMETYETMFSIEIEDAENGYPIGRFDILDHNKKHGGHGNENHERNQFAGF